MKISISLISIFLLTFITQSFALGSDFIPNNPEGDTLITKNKAKKVRTISDTAEVFKEDWEVNVTFCYSDKKYKPTKKILFTEENHSYFFPAERPTTSGFGKRHGSFHKGIDIPLRTGQPIVAAFDGKVRYAKFNGGGFGNLVIIRHINGLETYYAHLSRFKVKPNQIVKAGDVIGLAGNTGRSYGSHLHFEVRYMDKAIDPAKIFDTENYCLRNEEALVGDLLLRQDFIPRYNPNEEFLAGGTVYAIKPGDTLSKIANRNHTTVHDLCVLNGLNQNSILQIGQRIRVK